MFSKTFFTRLKHANDVTFLTGSGLLENLNIPTFGGVDMSETHRVAKGDFIGQPAAEAFGKWVETELPSIKPTLGHYAFVDMAKKLANLHLMTINVEGLHQKAGSMEVIEINGNAQEGSIRFEGEQPNSYMLDRANEVSAICEVFVLVGVKNMDKVIEVFPYLSKGNGSYVVEIAPEETDFTRHCNEALQGDVSDWLTKISLIINKLF